MTGTVATAVSAFFRPSPPRGMIRSTSRPGVASSASSSRPPPATRRDRALGQAGRVAASAAIAREHRVGVRGGRRAAQHDRVARLQAQRGGVDRHVRARLVDDRDDAERHAHLARRRARWAAGSRRSPRRPGRAARRSSRTPAAIARDALVVERAGGRAARRTRPASRPASRSRALASRISAVRASSASAIASQRRVLRGALSQRAPARATRRLAATADVGDGGDDVVAIGRRKGNVRRLRPARSSRGGRPPRWPAAAARAPRRTSAP